MEKIRSSSTKIKRNFHNKISNRDVDHVTISQRSAVDVSIARARLLNNLDVPDINEEIRYAGYLTTRIARYYLQPFNSLHTYK